MKKTPEELQALVGRAWASVRARFSMPLVIFTFQHTRSGGIYDVVDIVLREADLVPLVIYQQRLMRGARLKDEDHVKFARPLEEFLERFTPIQPVRD